MDDEAGGNKVGGNAVQMIKAFVERVERIHEERDELSGDVRDIYKEVKTSGLDVKALKAVIAIRRQDQAERRERGAVIETYLRALGMEP